MTVKQFYFLAEANRYRQSWQKQVEKDERVDDETGKRDRWRKVCLNIYQNAEEGGSQLSNIAGA